MVTTYKGNVGHLMQHWTLCKLLDLAKQHRTPGLNYIDAHAMAPLAVKNENKGNTAQFITVRDRLPQQYHASTYQRAWHNLDPTKGYPNSAAFVAEIWEGDFSLLLCEIDPETNAEIESRLQDVRKLGRCKRAKLFQGDWRERFKKGLPSPSETGLEDGALTLVSFDPNMCSSHWNVRDRKNKYQNLYPEDLDLAMAKMKRLKGGILIQLSTYSTNGNNPQGAVIGSVHPILAKAGFKLLTVVPVKGGMMSMVYERNVPWQDEVPQLLDLFRDWFQSI